MTDLTNYDTFVNDMLISKADITHCVVAMSEEVGEACGKLKRLWRGDYNYGITLPVKVKFEEDMAKELGDILYYLTAGAHSIGLSLSDIMEINMVKLKARKEAGTLRGNGDNR